MHGYFLGISYSVVGKDGVEVDAPGDLCCISMRKSVSDSWECVRRQTNASFTVFVSLSHTQKLFYLLCMKTTQTSAY